MMTSNYDPVSEELSTQLNILCRRAFETAKSKGWHVEEREKGTLLALMHSEISECLEALRKGNPQSEKIPGCSQEAEELADLIIRVFDYCGKFNIDLGFTVVQKMHFNKGRSHKHGGKEF